MGDRDDADFPDCAFWDFSVAVYARERVADACLALQDRDGARVNLLLLCCWAAASGRGALDDAALARAMAATEAWHGGVVARLRAARRAVREAGENAPRATVEALRRRLLAVELDGERIEQSMLAATLTALPDPARGAQARFDDAAIALGRYCARVGIALDRRARDDLAALLAGVFPELPEAEIAARCRFTSA